MYLRINGVVDDHPWYPDFVILFVTEGKDNLLSSDLKYAVHPNQSGYLKQIINNLLIIK